MSLPHYQAGLATMNAVLQHLQADVQSRSGIAPTGFSLDSVRSLLDQLSAAAAYVGTGLTGVTAPSISPAAPTGRGPNGELRCAYVFLLMKGEAYLPGLRAVTASLRASGTKHDLICLHTRDVRSKMVTPHVTKAFEVDYLTFPTISMKTEKQRQLYGKWISDSFTKWQCLRLVYYDRILFLDLDTIVLENLDSLFSRPSPAATFSSPWGLPFKEQGMHNPYRHLRDGDAVPGQSVKEGLHGNPAATNTGSLPFQGAPPTPGRMGPIPRTPARARLGSAPSAPAGSFVCIGTTVLLTPSHQDYERLLELIRSKLPFGYPNCYNGFDEQALAALYIDQWHHIGQRYNMIERHAERWLPTGEKAALSSFRGVNPWEVERGKWPDLEVWWRFYEASLQQIPLQEGEKSLLSTAPVAATTPGGLTAEQTTLRDWVNSMQEWWQSPSTPLFPALVRSLLEQSTAGSARRLDRLRGNRDLDGAYLAQVPDLTLKALLSGMEKEAMTGVINQLRKLTRLERTGLLRDKLAEVGLTSEVITEAKLRSGAEVTAFPLIPALKEKVELLYSQPLTLDQLAAVVDQKWRGMEGRMATFLYRISPTGIAKWQAGQNLEAADFATLILSTPSTPSRSG